MNKCSLIKSDLYRYCASSSFGSMLKIYLKVPGFRLSFWFRLASGNGFASKLANIIYTHYRYKFGIDLARETTVGPGLYIGHFSGIVVTPGAVIGRNCNLSQNVTIGVPAVMSKNSYPVIGDNVYIGAGAVILGAVTIGDNSAIGANSVVTHDVPACSRVAGAPARILNNRGTADMINNLYEG